MFIINGVQRTVPEEGRTTPRCGAKNMSPQGGVDDGEMELGTALVSLYEHLLFLRDEQGWMDDSVSFWFSKIV